MHERILLVEDDDELRRTLDEYLTSAGYRVTAASNGAEALTRLSGDAVVDLLVTDLVMPVMDGQRLLAEAKKLRPELDVVVLTAFGTIDNAIKMVKAGATEYLTKPIALADLLRVVRATLESGRGRRDVARAARADRSDAAADFVGSSGPMLEMYRAIARMAGSWHPVLVCGEPGTGKERVAQALHRLSGRRTYHSTHCGALPEHLMETELRQQFEAADGGTLFLDEIAELPRPLQLTLYRTLENGEIRRPGSSQPVRVNVRVVAATNRDLEAETSADRFRRDLFWRLNSQTIRIPPLRDRPEDIPGLVETSVAGTGVSVEPEAMRLLMGYPWPGNVRELKSTLLQATSDATGPALSADDLPARIRDGSATTARDEAGRWRSLRDLERIYILEVLNSVQGNRSRASEILGVDRKTLYRKLAEYQETSSRREAPTEAEPSRADS